VPSGISCASCPFIVPGRSSALGCGPRLGAARVRGSRLDSSQKASSTVQPRTCSSCSGPFPRGRAPAGSRHSPYSLRWPRSPHSPHSCCGVGRCLTWPARCGSCAFVEGKRRDAVSYRDLAGTIAVVTGGSRGIGAETARRSLRTGPKSLSLGATGPRSTPSSRASGAREGRRTALRPM
jgi:hypothetical protein